MPVLSVSVELPPVATEAGLNDAVAPVGRPLALSAIDSAEPLTIAVAIEEVPLAPWTRLKLAGLAAIEKSFGAAVTVSDTVVLCVALAAVPVTVMV